MRKSGVLAVLTFILIDLSAVSALTQTCTLLSAADVEKLTGTHVQDVPYPLQAGRRRPLR
jgi:hypothetical protein